MTPGAGAETASLRSRVRVRAPELVGRGWLNTGGRSLSLADLRGRVVVLDFWTFCCVNCLHVLDELRPVEAQFPDALTIIGVHSPKFEHEADADALAAAVERYAVHHPVLDDPELVTWKAYAARAWPTLVVLDPEGYVVASMSGEGHGPGLASLVAELVEEHRAKGTLQPGDDPYVPPPAPDTALRFPGKAVALPDGSFVVSDTANHEVVHLEADLETERARWGGAGPAQRAAGRPARDARGGRAARHRPARRRLGQPPGQGNPLLRRLDPRRRRHRVAAARAHRAAGPPSSRRSRPRGTSRGSATGSSSRWRARTSCGRWTPGDTLDDGTRRGRRRHVERGPRRRSGARGVVRPALRASRPPPPATASGWPTPRPPPCGR